MIFKIISLLFILNSFYYILNYKRLDEPFRMRDENKKLDIIHYLLKVLFPVWLIISVFNSPSIFIWILISIILLRIPIYLISKPFSIVYHRLVPIINIILLLINLFY